MAYQANRRKENITQAPLYHIDGVIITSAQFMHDEWWYVINNSWAAESSLKGLI